MKQYDFFFDDSFMYAVKVRHPPWVSDLVYNFFSNNNICMVWNQLDKIQFTAIVTSDFTYLRLIGDRSIKEADFGNIQKDRENEIKYWSNKFNEAQENEKDVKVGIVAANNHYAGFGAATANIFRVITALAPVEWVCKKNSIVLFPLNYNFLKKVVTEKLNKRHCLIIKAANESHVILFLLLNEPTYGKIIG